MAASLWTHGDSNSGPFACKANALPTELWAHLLVLQAGLEPAAFSFVARCSDPTELLEHLMVASPGLEPGTMAPKTIVLTITP